MKTTLYHGSCEKLTDLTIRENDLFHGMFFSADRADAASHGEYMYKAVVEADSIATLGDLLYGEGTYSKLVEIYGEEKADIITDIIDFENGNGDYFELEEEDTDEYKRLTSVMFDYVPDADEASWAAQRIACEVADKLGYVGIELPDEHGTSVALVPGVKMEQVDDGDDRNDGR